MLHKRYASPFFLLDNLIVSAQFSEWVTKFLQKTQEEEAEQKAWEFFLHKVYDKSFVEWKEDAQRQSGRNDVMDEAKKKEIISHSSAILEGFNPMQQGVNEDG